MSALRSSVEGVMGYRGREGQWTYLMHRATGLGTLLFLMIHILDTSTVYFFPSLYAHAIDIYRSTPFMLGEMVLVFAVIYHGVNGLRVALFDLFPHLWREQAQEATTRSAFVLSVILWLPAVFFMGRALIQNNF